MKRQKSINRNAADKTYAMSKRSLAETTHRATRMLGRSDGRYANVGFRCVRLLWSPPSRPEAGMVNSK